MKKRKFLHLTGGLGNQLFQLAAGLYFTQNNDLIVLSKNGKPRTNEMGRAEIFSYILPDQINTANTDRYSSFISRVRGFIIRISANPRIFEKNLISNFGIRFIASLLNIFYLRYPVRIMKVDGIGYIGSKTKANFLIGYYQSFRYATEINVSKKLNSLRLANPSKRVSDLISQSKLECPLIVHIRRGDYAMESGFGMLGDRYYEEAIKVLISTAQFKSIWVFSDEISKVVGMFDDKFDLPIRYIGDVDNSASALLEVMRHGKGYIIGNSSFSWWAAFLRYDKQAKVIAPTPWFADQSEPKDLIPPDWLRLPGRHFFISPLELEREKGRPQ